jgi:Chaperone of endosialidase
MNRKWMNAIVAASLVLAFAAAPSWAQLPPSNDTSDSFANTGGGSGALTSDTPSSTSGFGNTAYGDSALAGNTSGTTNVAVGVDALELNTTGSVNTAVGVAALFNNNASNNTAVGYQALTLNTSGFENTAVGFDALEDNTTGVDNTAIGYEALPDNSTGFNNTALGWQALLANTSGVENTATGQFAMRANTVGNQNTADGKAALFGSTGNFNTGTGYKVLFSNTGNDNTAAGWESLFNNTSGTGNVAFGFEAGSNLTTGSNNIEVGNLGTSHDSDTIRIGTKGTQKKTFIAGISDTTVTGGADVVVNNSGQLGVAPSSARYKRDIHDMGDRSQRLMQLRPVTFRYKQDLWGQRQYGLIAEEVAKVYPELVVRGDKGEVESVQYRELIPMLLNELQHQQRALDRQSRQLSAQAQHMTKLEAENENLRAAMVAQNGAMAARLERLEQAAARTPTLVSR